MLEVEVRWTTSARLDRIGIRNYIAKENRIAAARMDTLFSKAAETLAKHPNLGKLSILSTLLMCFRSTA